MKVALLCLCLASTAFAAPPFFHYLPHYTSSRQGLPQTGFPGAYSMEFLYPHPGGGTAAGGPNGQPFPTHGFVKYSIPQPPGRQSVEVYYPYDFTQQMIIPDIPPMSNIPHNPNVQQFDFPPQNIPRSPQNIPSFPFPSQDPLNQAQQDQPTQTSQVPMKV